MPLGQRKDPASAQGMALIAVLWLVAALSIIATGLVNTVRGEVRLVSLAKHMAVAGAHGDAAIHLVLQAMQAEPPKYSGKFMEVPVEHKGLSMVVELRPLNGLIDINNAPLGLLVSTYQFAAGLDARQAELLAQATVEARTRKDATGKPMGFEAPEDLLGVPGVTYPLYAKLKGLITASLNSGGKVNPMAAPEGVLSVLGGGNQSAAAALVAARASNSVGTDFTGLNTSFIDNAVVQRIMLTARVPMQDAAVLRRTWYVDLAASPAGGVPWRTFQTERVVHRASEKFN